MIRVLVAEDSTTVRELLVSLLSDDSDIEVVAAAKDGREAVELTKKLRPDVITMDIRMPHLDGFEATKTIMVESPTPIVIVSGSLEVQEVEVSMHALRVGALTVLPKPTGPHAPDFAEQCRRFVQTVKAMAGVKVVRRWPQTGGVASVQPPRAGRIELGARLRIVALAASTGGPAALYRILSELPGDFPAPIVAVQHMAEGFVAGLAAWLNTGSALHVKIAEDGETLIPRNVYLAPDRHHLEITSGGVARISATPPIGGFQPSATPLFASAVRVYGASTLAVILTGMGSDGLDGLRAVREAGGTVIAQDEPSSVVFGMPAAAIQAGLANTVAPLDTIARRIAEAARNSRELV